MLERDRAREAIEAGGVAAVLRGIGHGAMVQTATAINDGGVRVLEVTADAKRPGELLAAVDEAVADDPETVVGAGTVMDAAAARTMIDAGASFVFSPTLNEDVIEVCNREGVLAVPGIMTPTEADRAMAAGADMLKLFPASTVGPDHIGAIRGPLGDVPVMPTGGIGPDDVAAFFDAGAVAVGAGSGIVDYDAVEREDWDAVRERAETFVASVEAARS